MGDADLIEKISDHIESHLGPISIVFHERVSTKVHLDVYRVDPSPERDFFTLVTSGMSERSMKAPEGFEECQFAELMLSLPSDWPLEYEDFDDECNHWPVRLLKELARFPHVHNTWLWEGHAVENGDKGERYAANTAFVASLLVSPMMTPDEFDALELDNRKTIRFFAAIPLYAEELALQLESGMGALARRFQSIGLTELIDVTRPNVCRRE